MRINADLANAGKIWQQVAYWSNHKSLDLGQCATGIFIFTCNNLTLQE